MSSGKYLGPIVTSVNLYEKILRKGVNIIDNYSAMYLFSDELYGKIYIKRTTIHPIHCINDFSNYKMVHFGISSGILG